MEKFLFLYTSKSANNEEVMSSCDKSHSKTWNERKEQLEHQMLFFPVDKNFVFLLSLKSIQKVLFRI